MSNVLLRHDMTAGDVTLGDGFTLAGRTERWVEPLSLGLLALTILYATVGLPGLDSGDTADTNHVNPLNSQIWLALLLLGLPVLIRRWRAALALATANRALLALMAYFALSTTWALDPSSSVRRLLFMLVQFLVLTAALTGIRRSPSVHVVIAAVCTIAATADLAWWIAAPGAAVAEDGFTGLQTQKNQTGLLMMYGCLASCPCVFLLRRRLWQAALAAGTMVTAALLVATRSTTSQSVVIAGAVVMPLLLVVARLPRRFILAIAAVAVLLPAAALLGDLAWCGVTGQDPLLPLRGVTVSERTPIWQLVISEIAKRPWLGAGYSSFWAIDPAVQPSLKSGPALGVFSMINEGHEGYLDLLATGGIVGLTGGLFILLRAIVLGGRAVATTRAPALAWRDGDMARPTAIFHLAFLLGLMVHNFTESNLFTNSGLLAVAFMLCLLDLEKWRLGRRASVGARQSARMSWGTR